MSTKLLATPSRREFGKAGIMQMERTFRQAKKLSQQLDIIRDLGSGSFETDEETFHVELAREPRQYYVDTIRGLLKSLGAHPFGYFIVDGCLLVAGMKANSPEDLSKGDFLLRHAVHHTFSRECALCGS